MGDYQRLQQDAENDVHVSHLQRPQSRDDIYYSKPSSALHKFFFFISVALCVVVIVVFLWVLPCNLNTCTEHSKDNMGIFSWNRTLTSLELKGKLHFMDKNLVGILRGSLWGRSQGQTDAHAGMVISLIGKTGEVAWMAMLKAEPKSLDCTTLDLDGDGIKDCVVLGDNGYLVAIHSVTGIVSWKLNSTRWPEPLNLDLPISIPDIDKDKIGDLVAVSRLSGNNYHLTFISGQTGVVLSEPKLNSDCNQIYNLTYDVISSVFRYTCSMPGDGLRIVTYPYDFGHKAIPEKQPVQWKTTSSERKQRVRSEDTNDYRVILSNTGTCPTHCFVQVNVTNRRNQTIWSYHTEKAYVMTPVNLHFKHSISGFLLKLWHWHTTNHRTADMRIELIKERIILITLPKYGNMHVVNASQTDITQFCNKTECQPQLSFQTQSALIVDLNEDGLQDLVSYYVTYRPTKEDPFLNASIDEWELQSSIRVVRLEAALSKLYEAVSKH